jgi:cytoskeletal protein RodZ
MDMQDKEFDKIFNEKFEDFEVEPSAMVWDNIAGELDGKKTKVVMMPWLSIAATVLVVLTAGILFLQKGKSTGDQPKENKLVANHVEPVKAITPAQSVETVVAKPADNVASTVNHPHNSIPSVNNTPALVNTTGQVVNTIEPVKNESPQLIAAGIDPASTHVSTATVPDVTLTSKVLDATPQVERPVMAAQPTTPVKKHGIHSLGGLINVLVAKVDKREDKLIEFSDSDDDDNGSDLTGINLGLIKIKKQQ